MRIIPAIDLIDGKCVRLSQGDYTTQKIYNENPLEVAKQFEDYGFRYLHLVDLDGAKAQRIINYKILEQLCSNTSLSIDFGGGIQSQNDLDIALNSGADQITGGSIAIQQPEIFIDWLQKYGPEKIILGADCKNRKIATQGWSKSSDTDVVQLIEAYTKKGVSYAICTDISKDGMLQGPSLDLYTEILNRSSIKLIASGGVSHLQDLLSLQAIGCEASIIGKAIYEGKIQFKELQNFNL
ncbi:1-(5-phosphoribosyl)-5-[(5-phosphoribosylamino)methylideneamino]imidazole-4-carboxamide isomerase [Elizabethkingia argentiflava]|uniref:1-(5-phosphoribosyl)-5-[(5-phosphoribosylamino)methylideneamino] imidazole-4-carboxamide isomerase n=1 Tax=Elizabethkingia argenteiflava TaxID=2681556 RepID=A0A845PVH8_9FLAO|nr:1-(5-phosphoribosyl)-5-[(5-phosphoribosylamino)methylideneamino]imidazole-4-carboxamide isomerase [Elizabethkingia argenteiflava]NAW50866.1 1-(5-phosphoribosyl)-5-[(5-phosphoribosylamino)methylideneamino]imidazole-4-carboxamide isomerase [Elizabethkingia argenteiflava]